MDMVTERGTIIVHFKQLEDKAERFSKCFIYLEEEEAENNDDETVAAWKIILRKLVVNIHSILTSLKEEIAWSLLDDGKLLFKNIKGKITNQLILFKEYEEENTRQIINNVVLLIDAGIDGFRKSYISDTYYEDLFNKEMERYRTENEDRLKLIYNQDCADNALQHPDENELKSYMVTDRLKTLFASRFGKEYHDQGRNIKKLTFFIIENKEIKYNDIDEFFDKYIALLIAQESCNSKHEATFPNVIFKDNVDVDKVMRKLAEFIDNKVITAQRHWFVVYKVFCTKKWLKREIRSKFVEQINSTFNIKLKCSKDDLKKVDIYLKNTSYELWTLDYPKAPQCCEQYKKIADVLDAEFQDSKYAKPGTTINTRRIQKLR